jgi:hypothetical protein
MSRRFMVRAVLAAASVLAVSASNKAGADAINIDPGELADHGCFGQAACDLDGADIAATGGTLQKKDLNSASGFGVSGGASGPEIDIGQTLRVDFDESRSIVAIKVLFLFNGPEFSDRAEKARVIADGTTYILSTLNDADDADATWSGPGTVTQCGATTQAGTGCFIITDPFPGAVSRLDFSAVTGTAPFAGSGTNDSDYSIGFIDVAAQVALDFDNCATASGCPAASVDGTPAVTLSSMQVANAGDPDDAIVIPVRLPDCRYIPQACVEMLPPAGDHASSENAAREILIGLGVIKPLVPTGPNRYVPAAQILNVKPLLPAEVTSLFDSSGTPPNGLPAMYVASEWRGQAVNDFWFDGLFFKTDAGFIFSDTFDGLIDVSVLTGNELGCVADLGDLKAWDMITTVSEQARSVDGRYIDSLINVGCVNPTKVKGTRLSLYSVNFEVAPDTFGPTIKSRQKRLTQNNDAVFARLVQSLWTDLGEIRANYACKQSDPVPAGGVAPLSKNLCKKLAVHWAIADLKVDLCVVAAFYPASSYQGWICGLASESVGTFESLLPAAATGPDDFNRLGELKTRVEVFQHVWEERFLNSLKPAGFCREKGTCPP